MRLNRAGKVPGGVTQAKSRIERKYVAKQTLGLQLTVPGHKSLIFNFQNHHHHTKKTNYTLCLIHFKSQNLRAPESS